MWEKIKEHKIFWLGFGIIFLLGGWLLFSQLFPSTPQEKEGPETKPELLTQVIPPEIKVQQPSSETPPVVETTAITPEGWAQLPKMVDIWEITSASATIAPSYWAQKFGFSGEPVDEGLGVWRWIGVRKIFRFDTRDNYISLVTIGLLEKGSLNLEQLTARARFYLKESGLDTDGSFALLGTQFKNGGEAEVAIVNSLAYADRVVFNFTPTSSGLPLLTDDGELYPTSLVLDRSGQMLTLRHYLWNFALNSRRTTPLKSYQTAMTELSEGKGKVVAVNGLGVATPLLTEINPTRVRLGYFFPSLGQKQLLPVLAFEGTAVDKTAGKSVSVTVLLWATE
ncbi:MAG: hypothetical protein AAB486_04230 [Patescibacteria group bacterium]